MELSDEHSNEHTDSQHGPDRFVSNTAPQHMSYLPTLLEDGYEPQEGVSFWRMALVRFAREECFERPTYNKRRNEQFRSIASEYFSPS